jgi:hypothetical protein
MKYLPSAIVDQELDIARAAYFGGEFAVYMSQRQAILLGEVALTAAGEGTWTPNAGASIPATGADLAIVPITPINSEDAVEISLTGHDTTAATPLVVIAHAKFSPPARAGNQSFNFARGFAQDMEQKHTGVGTPTGLFGALDATQTPTIVGGGANQKFRVYILPEATDYELIQATTEIDFNTKDRPAKGIDAGMESDFWVKRGKAQPGELTIGSKFRSFTDGMARYSGQKCTCMLVGLKEGQSLVDRLVFTQWVGAIKPKLPEGDGEATQESAGKFVDHLFFIAP